MTLNVVKFYFYYFVLFFYYRMTASFQWIQHELTTGEVVQAWDRFPRPHLTERSSCCQCKVCGGSITVHDFKKLGFLETRRNFRFYQLCVPLGVTLLVYGVFHPQNPFQTAHTIICIHCLSWYTHIHLHFKCWFLFFRKGWFAGDGRVSCSGWIHTLMAFWGCGKKKGWVGGHWLRAASHNCHE